MAALEAKVEGTSAEKEAIRVQVASNLLFSGLLGLKANWDAFCDPIAHDFLAGTQKSNPFQKKYFYPVTFLSVSYIWKRKEMFTMVYIPSLQSDTPQSMTPHAAIKAFHLAQTSKLCYNHISTQIERTVSL